MLTKNEVTALSLSPTKRDFVQIWNELLDVASKLSERWDPTSTNESDPGIVILKAITGIADKLNYNIDKNTLEAFMPTAAQEDSMRKLCDMLGYNMKYYRSAGVSCTIKYYNPDASQDEKTEINTVGFVIPRFTAISNAEQDVHYFTVKPYRVYGSQPVIDAQCLEGQIVKCESLNEDNIITVSQITNNRFYLPETHVAENGVFVFNVTQGLGETDEWLPVDNLNTQARASKVFKFSFDSYEGRPYIEFPDDYSELFADGVVIYYTRTSGADGNISPNTLTTLTLPSSSAIAADSFTVNNVFAAKNGADLESIQSAYTNFKKTIGTFDTLVTCRDYMNTVYNLCNDNGYPLVSNALVTDIRNDINNAITICSCDDAGIYYKERALTSSTANSEMRPVFSSADTSAVSKWHIGSANGIRVCDLDFITGYYDTSNYHPGAGDFNLLADGEVDGASQEYFTIKQGTNTYITNIKATKAGDALLDNFELVLYPFKAYSQITTNVKDIAAAYNKSFTYQPEDRIIPELVATKKSALAHTFRKPSEGSVVLINNYLRLNAIITTTTKLTQEEGAFIIENIKAALSNAFNMRELDFGEEIPFDSIISVIEKADPRIRMCSMTDPALYTTFSVYEGLDDDNKAPIIKEYAVASENLRADDANMPAQLKDTFNTEEAKQIYNKLAVRNVLAARVPLFNYNNTFKASFCDGPCYVHSFKALVDPEDLVDPEEASDLPIGFVLPNINNPLTIFNDNGAILSAIFLTNIDIVNKYLSDDAKTVDKSFTQAVQAIGGAAKAVGKVLIQRSVLPYQATRTVIISREEAEATDLEMPTTYNPSTFYVDETTGIKYSGNLDTVRNTTSFTKIEPIASNSNVLLISNLGNPFVEVEAGSTLDTSIFDTPDNAEVDADGNIIPNGVDGDTGGLVLENEEFVQARSLNDRTVCTYPAYVNYCLKLDGAVTKEARAATGYSLFELLDQDRASWSSSNPNIRWQKVIDYFKMIDSDTFATGSNNTYVKSVDLVQSVSRYSSSNTQDASAVNAIQSENEEYRSLKDLLKHCGCIKIKNYSADTIASWDTSGGKKAGISNLPTINLASIIDNPFIDSMHTINEIQEQITEKLRELLQNTQNNISGAEQLPTDGDWLITLQFEGVPCTFGTVPAWTDFIKYCKDKAGKYAIDFGFTPYAEKGNILWRSYGSGYAIGRSILPDTGKLMPFAETHFNLLTEYSNNLYGIYIVSDIGANFTPKQIKNGAKYALTDNDCLYIEYTESNEDGSAGDVKTEVYPKSKSEKIYIRPNGFASGSLVDSAALNRSGVSYKKEVAFPGSTEKIQMHSLGANESIEICKDSTVVLNSASFNNTDNVATIYVYKNFTDCPELELTSGGVNGVRSYTLKDGEYVFYTDYNQEELAYYGSGTEINLTSGLVIPKADIIDISTIFDNGISDIPWSKLTLTNFDSITFKEFKYVTLTQGDIIRKLQLAPSAETSLLSESWAPVSELVYSLAATPDKEKLLDEVVNSDIDGCGWEVRCGTTLKANKNIAQLLRNKDNIMKSYITLKALPENGEDITTIDTHSLASIPTPPTLWPQETGSAAGSQIAVQSNLNCGLTGNTTIKLNDLALKAHEDSFKFKLLVPDYPSLVKTAVGMTVPVPSLANKYLKVKLSDSSSSELRYHTNLANLQVKQQEEASELFYDNAIRLPINLLPDTYGIFSVYIKQDAAQRNKFVWLETLPGVKNSDISLLNQDTTWINLDNNGKTTITITPDATTGLPVAESSKLLLRPGLNCVKVTTPGYLFIKADPGVAGSIYFDDIKLVNIENCSTAFDVKTHTSEVHSTRGLNLQQIGFQLQQDADAIDVDTSEYLQKEAIKNKLTKTTSTAAGISSIKADLSDYLSAENGVYSKFDGIKQLLNALRGDVNRLHELLIKSDANANKLLDYLSTVANTNALASSLATILQQNVDAEQKVRQILEAVVSNNASEDLVVQNINELGELITEQIEALSTSQKIRLFEDVYKTKSTDGLLSDIKDLNHWLCNEEVCVEVLNNATWLTSIPTANAPELTHVLPNMAATNYVISLFMRGTAEFLIPTTAELDDMHFAISEQITNSRAIVEENGVRYLKFNASTPSNVTAWAHITLPMVNTSSAVNSAIKIRTSGVVQLSEITLLSASAFAIKHSDFAEVQTLHCGNDLNEESHRFLNNWYKTWRELSMKFVQAVYFNAIKAIDAEFVKQGLLVTDEVKSHLHADLINTLNTLKHDVSEAEAKTLAIQSLLNKVSELTQVSTESQLLTEIYSVINAMDSETLIILLEQLELELDNSIVKLLIDELVNIASEDVTDPVFLDTLNKLSDIYSTDLTNKDVILTNANLSTDNCYLSTDSFLSSNVSINSDNTIRIEANSKPTYICLPPIKAEDLTTYRFNMDARAYYTQTGIQASPRTKIKLSAYMRSNDTPIKSITQVINSTPDYSSDTFELTADNPKCTLTCKEIDLLDNSKPYLVFVIHMERDPSCYTILSNIQVTKSAVADDTKDTLAQLIDEAMADKPNWADITELVREVEASIESSRTIEVRRVLAELMAQMTTGDGKETITKLDETINALLSNTYTTVDDYTSLVKNYTNSLYDIKYSLYHNSFGSGKLDYLRDLKYYKVISNTAAEMIPEFLTSLSSELFSTLAAFAPSTILSNDLKLTAAQAYAISVSILPELLNQFFTTNAISQIVANIFESHENITASMSYIPVLNAFTDLLRDSYKILDITHTTADFSVISSDIQELNITRVHKIKQLLENLDTFANISSDGTTTSNSSALSKKLSILAELRTELSALLVMDDQIIDTLLFYNTGKIISSYTSNSYYVDTLKVLETIKSRVLKALTNSLTAKDDIESILSQVYSLTNGSVSDTIFATDASGTLEHPYVIDTYAELFANKYKLVGTTPIYFKIHASLVRQGAHFNVEESTPIDLVYSNMSRRTGTGSGSIERTADITNNYVKVSIAQGNTRYEENIIYFAENQNITPEDLATRPVVWPNNGDNYDEIIPLTAYSDCFTAQGKVQINDVTIKSIDRYFSAKMSNSLDSTKTRLISLNDEMHFFASLLSYYAYSELCNVYDSLNDSLTSITSNKRADKNIDRAELLNENMDIIDASKTSAIEWIKSCIGLSDDADVPSYFYTDFVQHYDVLYEMLENLRKEIQELQQKTINVSDLVDNSVTATITKETQLLKAIKDIDTFNEFYYTAPTNIEYTIDFMDGDRNKNTLLNSAVNYDVNNINNSFVISKLDIDYLSTGIKLARTSRLS